MALQINVELAVGRIAVSLGPDLQTKNLRKNPKFIVSFSEVYHKFILSYKVKIFIDFYM